MELDVEFPDAISAWVQLLGRDHNGVFLTSPATEIQLLDASTLDSDGDRLIDLDEVALGTDRFHPDSDRGGVADFEELWHGRDPLDASDDRPLPEDCNVNLDLDLDLEYGCGDTDCLDHPACPEDCSTALDEDGDGLGQCNDPDCFDDPWCEQFCTVYADDDNDGMYGCADPDCETFPSCIEDCTNLVDEDDDSLPGCYDPDCAGHPFCVEDCTHWADNDVDGLRDCIDPDCPRCVELCNNGRDDDGDNLTDCEDADCDGPACVEQDCTDGADNDNDGLADCDDDDCWGLSCGGISSQLLGGHFQYTFDSFDGWGPAHYSPIRVDREDWQWVGEGLHGEMRFVDAQGSERCTWQIARIEVSQDSTWLGATRPQSRVSGVTIEPGCTIPRTDPLPMAMLGMSRHPVLSTSVGSYTYRTRGWFRGTTTAASRTRYSFHFRSGTYGSWVWPNLKSRRVEYVRQGNILPGRSRPVH